VLQFLNIPFEGGVNRIRANSNTKEVAAWSDSGKVFVYNIEEQLKSLTSGGVKKVPSLANRPIFSYNGKNLRYILPSLLPLKFEFIICTQ